MKTYTNIEDFCKDLSKLITRRTPHAGRNVTLEDTPNGFRIHCDVEPGKATTPAGCTGKFIVTEKENLLEVGTGYLNRNGEFLVVPEAKGIKPSTGTLCVCTKIDKSGKWTKIEFKITTPAADAYPIAEITVDEKTKAISIRQFPVVVAEFKIVKICPQIEASNG